MFCNVFKRLPFLYTCLATTNTCQPFKLPQDTHLNLSDKVHSKTEALNQYLVLSHIIRLCSASLCRTSFQLSHLFTTVEDTQTVSSTFVSCTYPSKPLTPLPTTRQLPSRPLARNHVFRTKSNTERRISANRSSPIYPGSSSETCQQQNEIWSW